MKSLDTIVPVCAPDMDEERFVFEHVGQVSFKINAIIDENADEWRKHQCRRERLAGSHCLGPVYDNLRFPYVGGR